MAGRNLSQCSHQMRYVLYADDMEPITVLELGPFLLNLLQTEGRAFIAPCVPVRYEALENGVADFRPVPRVQIVAERFMRKGQMHMMLFTADEEQAMLLKSAFLPGQRAELNREKVNAFARGFLQAIQQLG